MPTTHSPSTCFTRPFERKYKNVSIITGDMSVSPIWKLNKQCYKYNPDSVVHKSLESTLETQKTRNQMPSIHKTKSISSIPSNSTILKLINERNPAKYTNTKLVTDMPIQNNITDKKSETIFHFENSKDKIKEEEKRIKTIVHRECSSIMNSMLKFEIQPKKSIQISDKVTNFTEWERSYDQIIEQYKQNRNATRI